MSWTVSPAIPQPRLFLHLELLLVSYVWLGGSVIDVPELPWLPARFSLSYQVRAFATCSDVSFRSFLSAIVILLSLQTVNDLMKADY